MSDCCGCCHPTFFGLIFNFCHNQIVEDVQSFYRNSFTDAPTSNATAIMYIYHKTVSYVWLQLPVYCEYSVMVCFCVFVLCVLCLSSYS